MHRSRSSRPRSLPWALLTVATAATLIAACSEPLTREPGETGGPSPQPDDWTIPVSDDTEVFGYAPVPLDERQGNRIELVEDLVIRSRGEDERYLMYLPRDIDVVPDGSIYVLDEGYFHVKVYDARGEHIQTFSNEGEGPGELAGPRAATIAADRYLIDDRGTRLSAWSLDGEYIDDIRLPVRPISRPFVGLDDGSVLISFLQGRGDNIVQSSRDGALSIVFARHVPGEETVQEYAAFAETILLMGRGPNGFDTPLRDYQRSFAGTPDGNLYLTNGDEYQVLSLDAAGATRWALHVAWPRQPHSEEEIDYLLEQYREGEFGPDVARSELIIADRANTLEPLQIDGHGNLYVFLQTFVHPDDEPQDRPVDVFSPQGEHLFSGYMPVGNWHAARGDFIYRLEFDVDADEQTIVRYRLVRPF